MNREPGNNSKDTEDEADKIRYQEEVKKYEEGVAQIKAFGLELKNLFHKSQDTFEKQLSYISAGALALSVGFIKDIVQPLKSSEYKWMLLLGWLLLIATLLINLVSHMFAAKYARQGSKETEDIDNAYDSNIIDKRAMRVECMNWTTVGTLAVGIILIVSFITLNAIIMTEKPRETGGSTTTIPDQTRGQNPNIAPPKPVPPTQTLPKK